MGIKKVCIYGVGGVGGYFGGKMARKISNLGSEYGCYFIARNEHLSAIKLNGLKIITPEETFIGVPTIATDNMYEIPYPDFILLCVKGYDLDMAVKSIRSKVNANTLIMPLLNGVDIYERIRSNLDRGTVLPACVFIGTHIQSAGVIQQTGGECKIIFGCDPASSDFIPENLISFFDRMELNYQFIQDPFPAIWEKYIFISAFGLVSALTGSSLGEIIEDENKKVLVLGIMEEIESIARKKGVKLSENIIKESVNKAHNFPYETRTSYQRDIETKGRMNEGDLFGGTVIKEGIDLGIPTPVTESVYYEIQRWSNR